MSSYDDELRTSLKSDFDNGQLSIAGEASEIFDALGKAYPNGGSKIDWKRVPGSIEESEDDEASRLTSSVQFFSRMLTKFKLTGSALYVGDGLTDFAVAGEVDVMRENLSHFLEIPQHHYFVGPNCRWCMSFTMEGDMAFGRIGVSAYH